MRELSHRTDILKVNAVYEEYHSFLRFRHFGPVGCNDLHIVVVVDDREVSQPTIVTIPLAEGGILAH